MAIQTTVDSAVVATGVRKTYGRGAGAVTALDGVSVTFGAGRFTAVMGPSGSGKSTLMHCLAGLDAVDAGTVRLGDVELGRLSDKRLTELRRDTIGFVFQAFNLLPALTAAQNVALPLRLAGRDPGRKRVDAALTAVGLADRAGHRPGELSGGQQQRVAIARALVVAPRVLFADEPTGALDSATGQEVLRLLRSTVDDRGQTVVLVTHDPVAASFADRVVFLTDGRVTDELHAPTAASVAARLTGLAG
jgi:putative ABC transport system ATP-binding protein